MINVPYQRIREEDYWIYPIVIINIVCIAVAVYASVLTYRAPAVILGALGIWFTSSKYREGYSDARARVHIAFTVVGGLALALLIYILTN